MRNWRQVATYGTMARRHSLRDMPASHVTFRFGAFELDTAAYELRRKGRRIRLARQPMDLLLLHAGAAPSTLVTRRRSGSASGTKMCSSTSMQASARPSSRSDRFSATRASHRGLWRPSLVRATDSSRRSRSSRRTPRSLPTASAAHASLVDGSSSQPAGRTHELRRSREAARGIAPAAFHIASAVADWLWVEWARHVWRSGSYPISRTSSRAGCGLSIWRHLRHRA